MMEFSDGDVEEKKEELSNDLVVDLKQKITTSEEKVAELHLLVRMTLACFIRPPLAS
jgi:hypothetical protein